VGFFCISPQTAHHRRADGSPAGHRITVGKSFGTNAARSWPANRRQSSLNPYELAEGAGLRGASRSWGCQRSELLRPYVLSLIQDKLNRGETPSRIVSFKAHDFFVRTGRPSGGSYYNALDESLRRLKSTTIRTNIEIGDTIGGSAVRSSRSPGLTRAGSAIRAVRTASGLPTPWSLPSMSGCTRSRSGSARC
jgi:hypothetical protein